LADGCHESDIPFYPGHALYMKAIHGAKTKNDRIDSQKVVALLRAGMIPMAYTALIHFDKPLMGFAPCPSFKITGMFEK
jgi:hypothetical protein